MKAKKITALPSMVVYPNGSTKPLDDITLKERGEWNKKVFDRISEVLSKVISDNPEILPNLFPNYDWSDYI